MKHTALRAIFALTMVGPLGACAVVGPDYLRPEPKVPDAWRQELTKNLATDKADLRTWWKTLDDPVLDSLIERAAAGNLTLKAAFSRIRESRARLGVATGERYPDVGGSGFVENARDSEGIFTTPIPPQKRTDTFYGTGLDATWEIDFWGRISRSIESADANLDASVEDYRDVLVLLYADIALSYVDVRSLQQRIRFAEQNVATQQGTLELTRIRHEAQLVPELDVRQAELNLARTESSIPQLKTSLSQAINRVGVLLGEPPNTLYAELSKPVPIPLPPARVLVGVPADLVRQRPDIRRAERALAAQTARVGVATADLYPRFTLSGTFALETASSGLLDWDNRAWAFGPAFSWNLFDGGRVRNNIRAEDARTQQALVTYEQTVLNALEDVENAMVAFAQERDRRESLNRSVVASARSVELVQELYRSGLTDFQNVLDMERTLFQQQDAFAESEGIVTQQMVRVYRAFGGGWNPEPAVLRQEIKDAKTKGEPIF